MTRCSSRPGNCPRNRRRRPSHCRPRRARDTVAVESLTYPGVRSAASLLSLRLAPVAMDEQGLLPDAVAALCRSGSVKALYTLPTLHNPTATVLPLERRRALAEIARSHGLALVEDDVYGSLPGRYRALPASVRSAYDPGRAHLGPAGDLRVLAPREAPTDPYKPTPDELLARVDDPTRTVGAGNLAVVAVDRRPDAGRDRDRAAEPGVDPDRHPTAHPPRPAPGPRSSRDR